MSWVSSAISGVTSLFSGSGVGGASWGSLVGAGLSAYGQYSSSKSAATAQNAQAQAAIGSGLQAQINYEFQAGQMEANAQQALEEAANKALIIRQQGQKAVASVASQYAGSGVVANAGSAAEVQARTWGDVMQDVYTTQKSGASQAKNYVNQAAALRKAGTASVQASNITADALRSAASSSNSNGLLSAAASIAKIWA